MRKPGDIIQLDGTGDFAGMECIVMEVDPVDGRVTKAKSTIQDERLGRLDFLKEGDDYVIIEWSWSEN